MEWPAPVEYAVAVEAYLDLAGLSRGSRRVYQISLTSWAWPLVGRPRPAGRQRRGAVPPVLPLVLLDDPGTGGRVAAQFADRAATAGPRTANRELSALRSAVGWWCEQGWIRTDPTACLRHQALGESRPPLSADQVRSLFREPASLREHTLWRLLYDSGAPALDVLALDAEDLDLIRHRTRERHRVERADGFGWHAETSQLLRWLLAGRPAGPVFVTGRRAVTRPAQPARPERSGGDVWRATGQGRMSYRRAAEIFTGQTRPLDPAGHGWTLHQLSTAGKALPAAHSPAVLVYAGQD
jgi:integrase